MGWIRWLRWVVGYVRFRADGGFPERFLNWCTVQRIEMWDTKRDGYSLYACCAARNYIRLRAVARKSGVRMRLCSKHGASFRLRRYRFRGGLLVGAALYVLLLNILGGHIWVVDVHGNDAVSSADIEQAVARCGVVAGHSKKGIDVRDIQLKTLRLLPELSWLTVNMEGCTAHVMVSERQEPDEHRAPRQPANVKASADGVILSMEVYEGDALVQVGDAVTKGMLLVSGARTTEVGDYLTRAHANIIARTTHELTVSVPLKEKMMLPTGKVISRPIGYLFGIEIPWYNSGEMPSNYIVYREDRRLKVGDVRLPIGWYADYVCEQSLQTVSRTEEQANELATSQLAALEKELAASAEIRSHHEIGKRVGDVWQVTVTCECVENIAVQEDILLPKSDKKG